MVPAVAAGVLVILAVLRLPALSPKLKVAQRLGPASGGASGHGPLTGRRHSGTLFLRYEYGLVVAAVDCPTDSLFTTQGYNFVGVVRGLEERDAPRSALYAFLSKGPR